MGESIYGTTSREIEAMRMIAWEQAKGQLRAIVTTYSWDEEKYSEITDSIEGFITDFENNYG